MFRKLLVVRLTNSPSLFEFFVSAQLLGYYTSTVRAHTNTHKYKDGTAHKLVWLTTDKIKLAFFLVTICSSIFGSQLFYQTFFRKIKISKIKFFKKKSTHKNSSTKNSRKIIKQKAHQNSTTTFSKHTHRNHQKGHKRQKLRIADTTLTKVSKVKANNQPIAANS